MKACPPFPTNPVLQNNLAVLLELSGDIEGAEAMLRSALAEDAALPQVSKNLADILYRNGRYEEAGEAYERAAKLNPELGDDLYFKLGNIAYKRRDHAPGPRELGPGNLAQSGPSARPGQPRNAGPGAMTDRRRGLCRAHPEISREAGVALDAYKDKCLRRRIAVRMRACGVHTYRGLPGCARPHSRRVRAAEGCDHD